MWIAVIPFRHAYFTEWMAQYKNVLKVISQISLRLPLTARLQCLSTRGLRQNESLTMRNKGLITLNIRSLWSYRDMQGSQKFLPNFL